MEQKIPTGTVVTVAGDQYSNLVVLDYIKLTNEYGLGKYSTVDLWVEEWKINIKFSLEQALKIQREQLDEWKLKLNPQVYSDLETIMLASNEGKIDPYNIARGTSMDGFIANWKPGKPLNEIYF